jgi:hypothetical protein
LNKGSEQAEKASVATESLLWGLPASGGLPYNEFQGYAAVQ